MKTKLFKITSISDNCNSFGLKGFILVAKDGEAWEVGASDIFGKKNEVLQFNLNKDETPVFIGAEIPRRIMDAPIKVANKIWR